MGVSFSFIYILLGGSYCCLWGGLIVGFVPHNNSSVFRKTTAPLRRQSSRQEPIIAAADHRAARCRGRHSYCCGNKPNNKTPPRQQYDPKMSPTGPHGAARHKRHQATWGHNKATLRNAAHGLRRTLHPPTVSAVFLLNSETTSRTHGCTCWGMMLERSSLKPLGPYISSVHAWSTRNISAWP